MADKKKKRPWPTKAQTGKGGKLKNWVPHPQKEGWEIDIFDMSERKIKRKGVKK